MIVKHISATSTYAIRKKVLRENIPLPYEFLGDHDASTIHIGAFIKDELVGVSSFMKVQLNQLEGNHYQLRGMATLQEFQGKGIGHAMLLKAEQELRNQGCDLVWCNARVVALEFYKKNGYETIGESFVIEHVGPHYKMKKHL